MNSSTLIIAEAGVNHNGDPALALQLTDAAADAKADVVKFQTFRSEALASTAAPKADYQLRTTGAQESQLDMLRKLELSHDAHRTVKERCRERQIRFLSTPFDMGSLHFLTRDLGVDGLKIASSDLVTAPLLLAAARANLPVILSTGMARMEEIETALGIMAFGYTAAETAQPGREAFKRAYAATAGQAALKAHITLLHCTSEYPSTAEDANLRAMETMHKAFGLPVGLSDHTPGTTVAIAAVALGACVIEKHLTLDKSLPGPDHGASLDPMEFAELVKAIRMVETALGDGDKRPRPSEMKNKSVARKSLVAMSPIAKGEILTSTNLGTLRPGSGISALNYFDWLGRPATRNYAIGDVIHED